MANPDRTRRGQAATGFFGTLTPRAGLSVAASFDGVFAMESPDQLLGTVIDNRYRLSEFIGNGSYGSVFAAEEVTLGRVISKVAVKIITPESDEQRQIVLNEIVGLARFHHDYIIAYRSSGQIDRKSVV